MDWLDRITLNDLHDRKEQIDGGKPRERVLAAIGASKSINWIR